jgi:hypothetical protein
MFNRFVGQRPRPRWGLWIASALAIIALAIPAAAVAGSPTDSEYDTTNHQIAASGGSGGPSEPSGPSGGGNDAVISGLPFTGFDVGILALASVALLGSGLMLRRLSDPARRSSS